MNALTFNEALFRKYREGQARDARGRWTAGGGSAGGRDRIDRKLQALDRDAKKLSRQSSRATVQGFADRMKSAVADLMKDTKVVPMVYVADDPRWVKVLTATVNAILAVGLGASVGGLAVVTGIPGAGPIGWVAIMLTLGHYVYNQWSQNRADRDGSPNRVSENTLINPWAA